VLLPINFNLVADLVGNRFWLNYLANGCFLIGGLFGSSEAVIIVCILVLGLTIRIFSFAKLATLGNGGALFFTVTLAFGVVCR